MDCVSRSLHAVCTAGEEWQALRVARRAELDRSTGRRRSSGESTLDSVCLTLSRATPATPALTHRLFTCITSQRDGALIHSHGIPIPFAVAPTATLPLINRHSANPSQGSGVRRLGVWWRLPDCGARVGFPEEGSAPSARARGRDGWLWHMLTCMDFPVVCARTTSGGMNGPRCAVGSCARCRR
ncbi:hypothetical protein BDW22DRAFT_842226 [Trametopsis cervina]|nr:hypothetical protein BDW22DRAFT_842226 [Trametopsis cervina]